LRCGTRVRRQANRPANHDVVGAVGERLRHVDGALLIVYCTIQHRANSRSYHQQTLAELSFQCRRLQPRGNDAVAAGFERPPGTRENEPLDIALKTQVVEIALVETCKRRNRENFYISFFFSGRFKHRLVAMHRRKSHTPFAKPSHCSPNRLGNIEELQVDENLLPFARKPIDEPEDSVGHEQLQTQLVKTHTVPEALHQRLGLFGAGDVQCQDQALGAWNYFHFDGTGSFRLGKLTGFRLSHSRASA